MGDSSASPSPIHIPIPSANAHPSFPFAAQSYPSWPPFTLKETDHRFLLYTLFSVALVLGGHRTWTQYSRYAERAARRARIHKLVETAKKEKVVSSQTSAEKGKERAATGGSLVVGLLAAGNASSGSSTSGAEMPPPEALAASLSQNAGESSGSGGSRPRASSNTALGVQPASNLGGVQKRAKERKKRGRDALRQERRKSTAGARSNSPLPSTDRDPGPSKTTQHAMVDDGDDEASASRSRSSAAPRESEQSRCAGRTFSHAHNGDDDSTPTTTTNIAQARTTEDDAEKPEDGDEQETPQPSADQLTFPSVSLVEDEDSARTQHSQKEPVSGGTETITARGVSHTQGLGRRSSFISDVLSSSASTFAHARDDDSSNGENEDEDEDACRDTHTPPLTRSSGPPSLSSEVHSASMQDDAASANAPGAKDSQLGAGSPSRSPIIIATSPSVASAEHHLAFDLRLDGNAAIVSHDAPGAGSEILKAPAHETFGLALGESAISALGRGQAGALAEGRALSVVAERAATTNISRKKKKKAKKHREGEMPESAIAAASSKPTDTSIITTNANVGISQPVPVAATAAGSSAGPSWLTVTNSESAGESSSSLVSSSSLFGTSTSALTSDAAYICSAPTSDSDPSTFASVSPLRGTSSSTSNLLSSPNPNMNSNSNSRDHPRPNMHRQASISANPSPSLNLPPRLRSASRASLTSIHSSRSTPGSPAPSTSHSQQSSLNLSEFNVISDAAQALLAAQAETAGFKGALEASRRREENMKSDMERLRRECEGLRSRVRDITTEGRRRESDLETQLHHLAARFQSLSFHLSQVQHFQMQQHFHAIQSPLIPPSSYVGSPPSHPQQLSPFPYPSQHQTQLQSQSQGDGQVASQSQSQPQSAQSPQIVPSFANMYGFGFLPYPYPHPPSQPGSMSNLASQAQSPSSYGHGAYPGTGFGTGYHPYYGTPYAQHQRNSSANGNGVSEHQQPKGTEDESKSSATSGEESIESTSHAQSESASIPNEVLAGASMYDLGALGVLRSVSVTGRPPSFSSSGSGSGSGSNSPSKRGRHNEAWHSHRNASNGSSVLSDPTSGEDCVVRDEEQEEELDVREELLEAIMKRPESIRSPSLSSGSNSVSNSNIHSVTNSTSHSASGSRAGSGSPSKATSRSASVASTSYSNSSSSIDVVLGIGSSYNPLPAPNSTFPPSTLSAAALILTKASISDPPPRRRPQPQLTHEIDLELSNPSLIPEAAEDEVRSLDCSERDGDGPRDEMVRGDGVELEGLEIECGGVKGGATAEGLTFPSLSELGNPQPGTFARRVSKAYETASFISATTNRD